MTYRVFQALSLFFESNSTKNQEMAKFGRNGFLGCFTDGWLKSGLWLIVNKG